MRRSRRCRDAAADYRVPPPGFFGKSGLTTAGSSGLGGSTGINVAGAIHLAKQLGPGKTIVTILCDSGNRYQSKLFNPAFMRSKNLPVPEWLEKKTAISVPFEKV